MLNENRLNTFNERDNHGLFAVRLNVTILMWGIIRPKLSPISFPRYLLWALLFFKNYSTEKYVGTLLKVDPRTYRKWTWCVFTCRGGVVLVSTTRLDYNEAKGFLMFLTSC